MPSLNAFFISLPLSLLLAPSILASPIPIPPKLEHLGDLKTPSMHMPTPVINNVDHFDNVAPKPRIVTTPHFATPSIDPHPLAPAETGTDRSKGHLEGSNIITALLKDSILVDSLTGQDG